MNEFIEKLKQRWKLDTVRQVFIVLIIFSLAGMSCLYVRQFIFAFIGVTGQTPVWLKAILWVIVDICSYQILFLAYGFLLGQFQFVWGFEKKTFARVRSLFSSNK